MVTGVTEKYRTPEMFQSLVRGMVEAAGGRVTGSVSGKTNYLVAGDWHYNPFTGVEGPIENGSKYQKAIRTDDCAVISLDGLQSLIAKGGPERIARHPMKTEGTGTKIKNDEQNEVKI